jgi:ankyrin repeat protein
MESIKIILDFIFPDKNNLIKEYDLDEIEYLYSSITQNNFDIIVSRINHILDNISIIDYNLDVEINDKIKLFGKKKTIKKLNKLVCNNNIEFIILPITIIQIYPEDICHANFLIINKNEKIIYRFEPHGKNILKTSKIVREIDTKLSRFLTMNYNLPELDEFFYINIEESCPRIGPQDNIILLNDDNTMYENCCAFWELCYIIICVIPKKNVNNKIEEITNKIIKISSLKTKTKKGKDIYYDIYGKDIHHAMVTIMHNLYNWLEDTLWKEYDHLFTIHKIINKYENCTENNIQLKSLEKISKYINFTELIERREDDLTPLHLSIKKGLFKFSKFLIENGANVDALTIPERYSPLHIAAKYKSYNYGNHHEIFELLIKKNAKINVFNIYNISPFFIAAAKNDIDLINYMLSLNIVIDNYTNQGKNVIHYIVSALPYFKLSNFNWGIIEKLINEGISIIDQDYYGRTPLHIACQNFNMNAIIELLEISKKYNINILNINNNYQESPYDIIKDSLINKDLIDNHVIHREYLNNGIIDFDNNLNNEELYNYIYNFYTMEKNKIINLF